MASGTIRNSLSKASVEGSVVTSVRSPWAGPTPMHFLPFLPSFFLHLCLLAASGPHQPRLGGTRRSSRTAEGQHNLRRGGTAAAQTDRLSSHTLCCPISYLVSRRCVVLDDSSGGYWVIPVLRIPECRGVGARAGARGAVLAYLSLYVGNTVPWCPRRGHPYSLSALRQVLQILQPLHLLPAPADILHQDVVLGWREHSQQIYTASQFLMSFS